MSHIVSPFDGLPMPLPPPIPQRTAQYRRTAASATPAEVRHAVGYEPFVTVLRTLGEQPAELIADPIGLLTVIQSLVADPAADAALHDSAAVFLGNTIATLRTDARWRAFEDSPPTVGNRDTQFTPQLAIARLAEGHAGDPETFAAALTDWAAEDPGDSEPDSPLRHPIPPG